MSESGAPWPTEVRLQEKGRLLRVAFDNGRSHALPAEYLRVMSPSAEVQGHRAEERLTIGGKRDCAITGLEEVGSYALRIIFDDGHGTGIFTWAYLNELGESRDEKWASYEAELKAKGLSRDLAGQR